MSNPEKGVVSRPIIDEREYLEIFGMIVQEPSFDIIEAMHQIDANAQLEMLKTVDQEKPTLVVTHIHQESQAEEMDWSVGDLIDTIDDAEVHTLDERKAFMARCENSVVLIECRNGVIGYFRIE